MSKRKKNQLSKIQRTASEPAVAPGHLAGASAETRVPQSAPVATVADTHASGPAPSEVELPEAAVPGSETPESGPTPTTSGAPPVRRQKKVSVAPTRPTASPKPKGRQKATAKLIKPVAGEGTKTSKILALLQRPKGATLGELQQVTAWQSHSVRGFLSGVLTGKMGLKVKSAKRADGARVYSIRSK